MTLQDQLEEARATVASIEARMQAAGCVEAGHEWKHIGGRNACCDHLCVCSIPVYECQRCGDSDYGENAEAEGTMRRCMEARS